MPGFAAKQIIRRENDLHLEPPTPIFFNKFHQVKNTMHQFAKPKNGMPAKASVFIASLIFATALFAGFGAAGGAIEGAIVRDNLPQDSKSRDKVVAAGAAQGAVDGALWPTYLLPVVGDAIRNDASMSAASDVMGVKDKDTVMKAATAAGAVRGVTDALVPLRGGLGIASSAASGATTAGILHTDAGGAAKVGAISGIFGDGGSLYAVAKYNDKTN